MTPEHALPALYQRRERRRELAVGAFLIAGVVAVVVLLFLFTDPAMFRGRYYVATIVPDAGGVRKGDPVQLRGVNVGRIRGFSLVPEGVRIDLEVEGSYAIPEGSKVSLTSGGIMAGRIATILPGPGPAAVKKGAVLPGAAAHDTFSAVGEIASSAGQTMERLQALLAPETVDNAKAGVQAMSELLVELRNLAAEQRDDVKALTGSLRRSAKGLEQAVDGPELEQSLKRLDEMTKSLDGTVAKLDRSADSLQTVLGRMERGEGTLGRLSRDESLYVNAAQAASNIDASAKELRTLVEDVKKNPGKYLKLEVF